MRLKILPGLLSVMARVFSGSRATGHFFGQATRNQEKQNAGSPAEHGVRWSQSSWDCPEESVGKSEVKRIGMFLCFNKFRKRQDRFGGCDRFSE